MKAYTDEYIVKSDGIYRKEKIYHPGGEWEEREVLWLPRDVLTDALLEWQGNDKKESETNGRYRCSRQARKTGRNTIETP